MALFASSAAIAQDPTGALIGTVRDIEEGVLPHVTVT
jgi:hypothetical protein